MMEKRITSKTKPVTLKKAKAKRKPAAPVVTPPPPPINPLKYDYPPGCRFLSGARMYFVRRSYYADNTDMRLVFSDDGEQILTMASILSDAKSNPDFRVFAE